MKKFLMVTVFVMAFVIAAVAGQFGIVYDSYTNVTSNVTVATGSGIIIKIIPQDDGNSAAARTLLLTDGAGNTVFSRSYTVGQQLPASIFDAIGYGGYAPINYTALPFITSLTSNSTFKVKYIIKK